MSKKKAAPPCARHDFAKRGYEAATKLRRIWGAPEPEFFCDHCAGRVDDFNAHMVRELGER